MEILAIVFYCRLTETFFKNPGNLFLILIMRVKSMNYGGKVLKKPFIQGLTNYWSR